MKNILRENMRRFGTKNLNEAPESEYNPLVAMDDIVVDVMATRGGGNFESIKISQRVVNNNEAIVVATEPGVYNIDRDSIKFIISGKNGQVFNCSELELEGRKRTRTISFKDEPEAQKCEMVFALSKLIYNPDNEPMNFIFGPGGDSSYEIVFRNIKSNAQSPSFDLAIELGRSRFEGGRNG
tara:strand:+ start:133 stop:678 length:546 start_codon:yes stop_codon:yes gene_type:complete